MSKPIIPENVLQELRLLQEEIDQLQYNISTLEQQKGIIESAILQVHDSLNIQESLTNKKAGDDILVPIGGTNFLKCTIKDPKNVFVSIGSGVSIYTATDDAKSRNKIRIENLKINSQKLHSMQMKFLEQQNQKKQQAIKIAQQYSLQ